MSKMSNLDLVLDEMITAGQKMIEAATALREMFSETEKPEEKKTATKPLFDPTPAKKEETKPEPETKTYTFQEVRGIMASLSGKGMKAEAKANQFISLCRAYEAKALLTKFGASRLSEVKEDDYAALAAEAEALLNG